MGGPEPSPAQPSPASPHPCPPQGDHPDSYALLGELAPCGATDKETCLKTVVLLADKQKNVGAAPSDPPPHPHPLPRGPSQPRCPVLCPQVVVFKSDGSVLLNELQVNLPHVTGEPSPQPWRGSGGVGGSGVWRAVGCGERCTVGVEG